MKTFTVVVHYEMLHTMTVEAESEAEAKNIACEKFSEEDFCDDLFNTITSCSAYEDENTKKD